MKYPAIEPEWSLLRRTLSPWTLPMSKDEVAKRKNLISNYRQVARAKYGLKDAVVNLSTGEFQSQ